MRIHLKNFPFISAAILLLLLGVLFFNGMTPIGLFAVAGAIVWFGIEMVRWLGTVREMAAQRQEAGEDSDLREPESLVSLVYFLSEARDPTEDSIRDCIGVALNFDFQSDDPDAEYFVLQFTPPQFEENPFQPVQHYMVRIPEGLFSVLVSREPYIADPQSFAQDAIRDKRLRSAVEQHSAWISVDLMDDQSNDPSVSQEAYSVIGKILAAMAGPDCLAIYCPELQRCNEFDLSLMETLASGKPLNLFEEPTFEPIIEVADDDPRMAEAVAEAVNRWSEFVVAFDRRLPEQAERFIIKAEFREGDKSEFMWVTVSEILDDKISGVLMNDPHELLSVHRGAEVDIPLRDLNDWIYPGDDDDPVGGFTLKILAEEE